MTRRQKDEYDKKIAGALRKYMPEDGLPKATDPAESPAEDSAPAAAWLERPLARAKRKQFFRGLGRAAAIFLLILAAGFGTACAASSEVRTAVGNTLKKQYERWRGEWTKPKAGEIRLPNYFQEASYTDEENDWYYSIIFTGFPGLYDPMHAGFIGIDLRHRYVEGCWDESYQMHIGPDGNPCYEIIRRQSTGRWFGQGSEAEKRDRKIVEEIMKKVLDPDDSGDPDPSDYDFEVLDKDMFFDLLKKALVSAPEEWSGSKRDSSLGTGTYVEPGWLDGYRFQIITAVRTDGIDEVYIDVLYRTGDGYNDYDQLSDLVEAGNASAAQQELFALLQDVRAAIKEQNSFTAMNELLGEKKIEGIDFARLITFLNYLDLGYDADHTELSIYCDDPAILPWENVTISKEEWDEHLRELGKIE